MSQEWKIVESLVEPQKIDATSSPGNVYVRTNIQKLALTADGEEQIKWVYSEAFMSLDDYKLFQLKNDIANAILNEDDSEAFKSYKQKLDTPVEYTNGFLYKPKWAEGIYAGFIQKGTLLPMLFPLKIWDATETEENAVEMTLQELITLTIFLAQKQEQYFNVYKQEKAAN